MPDMRGAHRFGSGLKFDELYSDFQRVCVDIKNEKYAEAINELEDYIAQTSGEKKRIMYSSIDDYVYNEYRYNGESGIEDFVKRTKQLYELAQSDDNKTENIKNLCLKIADHAMLLETQHRYYSKMAKNVKEEANKAVKKAENNATEYTRKLSDEMRSQYTTILGILAAIMITIVGALEITGDGFRAIMEIGGTQLLKFASFIMFLAFFFFNIILIMFDFLREMNNKSVESRAKRVTVFGLVTVLCVALVIIYAQLSPVVS